MTLSTNDTQHKWHSAQMTRSKNDTQHSNSLYWVLCVAFHFIGMLNVIMLSVVILSVVMLNVVYADCRGATPGFNSKY